MSPFRVRGAAIGLHARDFFTTLDRPEAGALEHPSLPFRMRGTPG